MLVIVSDIHLGDGTTSASVSPMAFQLFASRLREAAYFASWRRDGSYHPIDEIDLVLLGDIIDPLHSTRWLETQPGDPNFVRPWTDPTSPHYATKLGQITQAIFDANTESFSVLRRCASGEAINIVPATLKKLPNSRTRRRHHIPVRIHYVIGNHDWYYHLPGPAFDLVREQVVSQMGLSNDPSPFPYDLEESSRMKELLAQYQLYARHGDCFDKMNFDPEKGRDHATLGDILTMEVFNRFPVAVHERFGDELPSALVDSLRRLTNIRPKLAAPLWISGQLKHHAGSAALEEELKKVWDDICDEFLELEVVREADKVFQLDIVDVMEVVVRISKHATFATINDLIIWLRDRLGQEKISFAEHALREPAFLDRSADTFVYGHTHHHEIVSLDSYEGPYNNSQVYLNSGTWRSYYDLAIKNPFEQEFIPYQGLTYLAFYKDDEREGHRFEAWSGTFM